MMLVEHSGCVVWINDGYKRNGLDMEFVASSDVLAIVAGGTSRGVATPANFDMVFVLDSADAA